MMDVGIVALYKKMLPKQLLDQTRKEWIDSLRAVAMVLVVYGHCVRGWTDYFIFTSPVKMPLFFIISGYLFKLREGNTIEFLKNLFRKLVVPWIVLGMIHYTNPIDRLADLISGATLWFMPCLIIGEIIWFFIQKYSKGTIKVVVSGIIVSAIGMILAHFNVFRFAMFNTALVVQSFFIVGYLIRSYEEKITGYWKMILILGLIIYFTSIMLSCWCFPGEYIDVHKNIYFNIPLCAIIIISGCISFFIVFKQKNINYRWLVYIGQNTLIIYIVHGLGINLFNKIIPHTFWGG